MRDNCEEGDSPSINTDVIHNMLLLLNDQTINLLLVAEPIPQVVPRIPNDFPTKRFASFPLAGDEEDVDVPLYPETIPERTLSVDESEAVVDSGDSKKKRKARVVDDDSDHENNKKKRYDSDQESGGENDSD
jgi:hypothetical protein